MNEVKIDFEHGMAAHCENGVVHNLLNHHNIELSEAMIFGIGSGLFFIHIPFLKMHGIPVTAFRPMPGVIFNRITKTFGVKVKTMRFKGKQEKSMQALDNILQSGKPVGMVVGVYHLTYFPAPYRFHFNGHNIVAFAKKDNRYLVSDPIMETPEWITYNDLKRVRYAKGTYKPNGKLYYIEDVPESIEIEPTIYKGLKRTCRDMLNTPGPLVGVSGIKYLANKIRKWPQKLGGKKAALYLGQVVRMQEEIGTGGAGFRFLFSAFLQEAAEVTGKKNLRSLSYEMTEIGDSWRTFAVEAARVCKGRGRNNESFDSAAKLLYQIADKEKAIFKKIRQEVSG